MSSRKGNPWNFVRRKCVRPILWIVLYFTFRHDYKSPDFVPVAASAAFTMAAIICSDIYDMIDQYFKKIDAEKMFTFYEWRQLKKQKTRKPL